MNLNKILKNTTNIAVFVNDTGVSIAANAIYDITEPELLLWVASTDVLPLIANGTLIVNNGIIDLNANDGARYLQYPERLTIQNNSLDVAHVTTDLNFTGSVTVTNNSDGKVTVDIGTTGASAPALREVTMVQYPFGPVNIDSNLLFEPGPVNDTVLFLKEEIL